MGSDVRTLLMLFAKNGTGRYPFHVVILLTTALLRWPFSTYERWQVSQRSVNSVPENMSEHIPESSPENIPESGPENGPIFIVGHWRSGTTFLYNVLSRAPQFTYVSPLATGLPWNFLTLGSWLQPLLNKALPKSRFIDRVPVSPDSPQEDEIALASMQSLSFYHGLYFPKHFTSHFNAGIFLEGCSRREIRHWEKTVAHFYKKLQLQHPSRQLLVKNPVYTARIAQLRRLWPNAKFIHIYRNPYTVFQSTENFYHKLFPEMALQPFDQVPIRDTILSSYPKMMEALYRDTKTLPRENFIELQFERFEANPMAELQRIYSQLGLDGWAMAKPLFEQYLADQKHYQKNQYDFSAHSIEQVSNHWWPFIARWGYHAPRPHG
ncbi:MAG: sulfotransferase [Cyanobacteria bacterium J06560_5]